MTKKKLFAITMALLLAVTVPLAVLAETYDLSKGSITIEAREDGQYVSQDNGVQEEKQTTKTVIEQDKSESETTSNTITIKAEKDTTAEVTISGVNIDVSDTGSKTPRVTGDAAISTGGEGNVTIELDGENTVKSGMHRAGLEKNNGGNLTIGDKDDNGALNATGGFLGAGIGGGHRGNGSNITIDGGDIKATGGNSGAGIGGGNGGDGTDITIDGGDIKATGGSSGAGIGGGNGGDGTDITIEGGDIKATGGSTSAGIGGGNNASGSNITITDSNVTASGGYGGAGIGGGIRGDGTDITITDSNVTASGGRYREDDWDGAGIGGGYKGSGTDITVSGDAQVKVSGDDYAADIGGGNQGNGEITANTDELSENGSISYFAPGADKSQDTPEKLLHKTNSGVETHENVSIKSKTDPTCTQPGSITYLCSCGDTVTQEIPAIPHSFTNYVPQNNATCEENETKVAECDYGCGTKRTMPIAGTKLNHILVNCLAKEPTCTEIGWEAYEKCSREGCTYTTRGDDLSIDPDNHDLEHHDGKEPTCTEDGYEEYDTCKRAGCGYTTYQKIDALNHSFTHYVYQDDATCLEDGTEIAACDHTGCTETDKRTAAGTATGHCFTDYVPNKNATYTQDGTETAECDHGCGETDTRTIEGSKLPLYRVTDENGKSVIHKANYSGSTLTITAELDGAILTGSTLALPVLQARGITTVVFVTNGTTSTFELADLLAKGEGTYALTHAGENVTFTLESADIAEILKAE